MGENILMIGLGAIGSEVLRQLDDNNDILVRQILVRPGSNTQPCSGIDQKLDLISSIDELDFVPDFVLECAGHHAVSKYAPHFLKEGIDFGVVSVGALSKPGLLEELESCGARGSAKLCILSGALGGVDALSAARNKDLMVVEYSARKPPASWVGTHAENTVDLKKISKETLLFEGLAREASELYPKNANVAATVALAGLGFDKTAVKLIADPNISHNIHEILAKGSFGEMSIRMVGNPLDENPKSSALTAYSAVRALKNRVCSVVI